MPTTPRIGSLCSGYRGLDAAVEAVFGGTTAWVSDIDPGASAILAHHWPTVPNLGDLTTVDWTAVEPVDIVCGGYPCQPFSDAGKRLGVNDERHIWPHIANALRVLRPRYAVFENVSGHLRRGFDVVLADLAELGFDVEWCVASASEVGAPHQRKRLWILASNTAPTDEGRLLGGRGSAEPAGRPEPGDCGLAAADASDLGHERGGSARHGWSGSADRGDAAADSDGGGCEGYPQCDGRTVEGQPEREPRLVSVRSGVCGPAADAQGAGWEGPGSEPAGHRPERGGAPVWGQYAAAVERWERVVGRAAPWAVDDRGRLNPEFVEFMMGLPAGHVTAVPGLSRNAQLRALGNGVVPQQAEAALRLLLARVSSASAAA